jgi:hypothetical protein
MSESCETPWISGAGPLKTAHYRSYSTRGARSQEQEVRRRRKYLERRIRASDSTISGNQMNAEKVRSPVGVNFPSRWLLTPGFWLLSKVTLFSGNGFVIEGRTTNSEW